MIIVHEALHNDRLVRHWANEITDESDMMYNIATYRIRQIETGILYDDAIDVIPCKYTYEATDEVIEISDDADEEDYQNALEEFGVNFDEEE